MLNQDICKKCTYSFLQQEYAELVNKSVPLQQKASEMLKTPYSLDNLDTLHPELWNLVEIYSDLMENINNSDGDFEQKWKRGNFRCHKLKTRFYPKRPDMKKLEACPYQLEHLISKGKPIEPK